MGGNNDSPYLLSKFPLVVANNVLSGQIGPAVENRVLISVWTTLISAWTTATGRQNNRI